MRVAAIQFEPTLGPSMGNLGRILDLASVGAKRGADVVLFPECALQGYVFDSSADAVSVAEPLDGAACSQLVAASRELDVALACGLLERTDGDYLSNTLFVALPDRAPVVYRKAHLPMLGVDRWTEAGDVAACWFDFRGLRFGLQICYDLRFPEPSRMLALAGVDAILLATNWPQGYEATADHAARTRAWENRCWLVAANRVGHEAGTGFIGRSLAVEPWGGVVAQASGDEQEVLIVDVDPDIARNKLLPGHSGETFDFFAARRPDLYANPALP